MTPSVVPLYYGPLAHPLFVIRALSGTLVARTALRDSLLPLYTPQEALLALGGRAPIRLRFTAADLILDGALGTDYLQRGPITLDLRTTPALNTVPNPRLQQPSP